MTDDIRTKIWHDGTHVNVNRVQDAEPLLEWAKEISKEPQHGEKLRPRWTMTNVQVEEFYNKYANGRFPAPRMDTEFWQWVDREIMTGDYGYLRLSNKANPFFMGYGK